MNQGFIEMMEWLSTFSAGILFMEWRVRSTWEQRKADTIEGIVDELKKENKKLIITEDSK